MIKIYGMDTCPDCDYVKKQIVGQENKFQYVDIGSHVQYMHEFMELRDNRKEFDHIKDIGGIGIPAFLLEDGGITLDPSEVGLVENQEDTSSCSIDNHKNGVKGC